MKMNRFLPVIACCCLGGAPLLTAAAPPGPVAAAAADEVRAEAWGFDAEDATACLQQAIHSGARRVVVGKMGSDWVLSRTIELASNQEIVFEDGVVIRAKAGEFKGIGDALFRGRDLRNLTLRGEGKVIFRMRKHDYQNPEEYRQGEWRHGINLSGCTNVVIRNLTISESGGDGLYLGAGKKPYCENVLVEGVIFEGHHRLGMAVISAQHLLVRDCRFRKASGASPMGGIDFEPNRPQERLVDCVVEDCVFEENPKGAGVSVSPNHLNADSEPVSVTIRRSRMNGNALGAFLYPSRRSEANPSRGRVELVDCELTGNTSSAVLYQDPVENGVEIVFNRCRIDNRGARGAALSIRCVEAAGRSIGNLRFEETTVADQAGREPIALRYHGNGALSDEITGALTTVVDGRAERFDLAAWVRREQAKIARINALQPATLDLTHASASGTAPPREGNAQVYLRGKFTYIQYAQEGESVVFLVNVAQVGDYHGNTKLELHAPDGRRISRHQIPPNSKAYPIPLEAKQTGIYRLVCAGTVQRVDITSQRKGNGILLDGHQVFLPIEGRLYFQVPPGAEEFSIGVAADAGAEVALVNARGETVIPSRRIESMELFSAARAKSAEPEIWALQFSKVGWHLTLRFNAPLPPLVSTDPATLLLAPTL